MDNEQSSLNSRWNSLRSDYPLTISFLRGCLRDANTNDQVGACMVTAIAMAGTCYSDYCSTGSVDFSTRIGGIATRYDALKTRRRTYPNCSSYVRDELSGL